MKPVYAVATGELNNISRLQQEKVQTWLGKQIFEIAPRGSVTPLLYTPTSASMMRWGDPAVLDEDEKLDRVLVPIMLYNARVRLTALERIVDDNSTGKEGANSKDLNRDLRHEIMTVAHCMQLPHANRADTMRNVRRRAYWPSAELSVSYYCDTCAVCLADRRPEV